MEHVSRSKYGLPVFVKFNVSSKQITVSADNLLSLGVPHDKLLVAVVHRVKLVDVHALACAAACLAERNLAQTSNFLHNVGRVVSRYNINLIVTLVSHSELTLRRKLTFKQFFVNRLDNLLFHLIKN